MFRRFMYGRYGFDRLNLGLAVLLLIFGLASIFTRWFFWPSLILGILQMLVLLIMIFRMFSRNIQRRRRENDAFMRFNEKVKSFFVKIRDFFVRIKESWSAASKRRKDKEHKYFKCPKCKARLRVPKGRGKITVTCPKCGNRFDKRS